MVDPGQHRPLPRLGAAWRGLSALALAAPKLLQAGQSVSPDPGAPDGVSQALLAGLIVLLISVGFTALCLICQTIRPVQVRSAALVAGRSPTRSLIYGLLTTVIVVLQLSLAKALPGFFGGLLSLLFIVPYVGCLILGATAAAQALGEKLLTSAGSPKQTSEVWAVLCGSLLMGTVNLVPFLGQAVMIASLSIGLGAMVRHVLGRKQRQTAQADTD